ncbi:MAG TPA: hypothetical protein ENO23_10400 [Alphaproteobacteria bacterium]|nr:hypothetical protein [Alphaproteobacteria bacterium]
MLLIGLMGYQFIAGILGGEEIVMLLLATISKAVVALATFELGLGIGREYPAHEREGNGCSNVRRTTTRFFGVVSIALVLEALIMVIKYSQLELAGNLHYPVAIIAGASLLMVSRGIFVHLTRPESIQGTDLGRGHCESPEDSGRGMLHGGRSRRTRSSAH